MRNHEDRVDELVDELNDHPEEDFLSGKMMRTWAERCIEFESEERTAMLAMLEHLGAPKMWIDLFVRGVHRKRSSTAMAAIRDARSSRDEAVE